MHHKAHDSSNTQYAKKRGNIPCAVLTLYTRRNLKGGSSKIKSVYDNSRATNKIL